MLFSNRVRRYEKGLGTPSNVQCNSFCHCKSEIESFSVYSAVCAVTEIENENNKIDINEPFGVILVQNGTTQLNKVLKFIQHVGYNLSSRLAQEYLFKEGLIDTKYIEEYEDEKTAYNTLTKTLAIAYNQPQKNVCLTPSGMNAIYCALRGLKTIQNVNNRTKLIQLGWLYLDTMNIVEHYFDENKIFYDINNLDLVEDYLKINGHTISAIITEIPTNPLLQTVDLVRLKTLCITYNIPLVIDATFATPFNLDLKPYADIYVESLTKFASGNADVLMGAIILNENSKISMISQEFFKHADMPYIKDIQRLAYEIKDYESRMKIISSNTKKLVEYFKTAPFIDEIFYCLNPKYASNYQKLMIDENSYTGIISVTFKKDFKEVYDKLNFAKGPSLGTEFTLLMPYTYLAHYDLITSKSGNKFLEEIGLPINLLRISVGIEDINEIINEFKRV